MSKSKENIRNDIQVIHMHRNKHAHHHRRHHRSKTDRSSTDVVHVKIQSLNSSDKQTNNSISNKNNSQFDYEKLKNSSFISNPTKYSKSAMVSNIVNKQNSQHIQETIHEKRKSKKENDCSIEINENPSILKSYSQSPKVAHYEDIVINDNMNISQHLDSKGVTNDYHRSSKKDRKRFTRRCAFLCLVGYLLLNTVLIITLLVVLSTRSNVSTKNTTSVLLRWNSIGSTVAGITGMLGNASNKLNLPWDVVVDWSYTLYVSDRTNYRVQKFLRGSTSGITIAGNTSSVLSSNTFGSPNGIYVDTNSNMYVADRGYHRIQYWANSATFGSTIMGNGTPGAIGNLLDYPYDVKLDSKTGILYIAEHNNHRISSFRFDNSSLNVVAGGNGPGLNTSQFWYPHAFFYDDFSNSFLIANAKANNVVRWKLGAVNWTLIAGDMNGSAGNTSTLLNFPSDVTIDPMGNVYVVDRYSHRVQLYLNGQSNGSTIAGVGTVSGNNSTLLNGPTSLALDGQLNLYVVDQNNHRVQKFSRY